MKRVIQDARSSKLITSNKGILLEVMTNKMDYLLCEMTFYRTLVVNSGRDTHFWRAMCVNGCNVGKFGKLKSWPNIRGPTGTDAAASANSLAKTIKLYSIEMTHIKIEQRRISQLQA